MVIQQGDVFWVNLDEPSGSRPGFLRPYVVILNNVFNQSRIRTVVACALTSNLKRALAPGNVLLDKGEANLPKRSVVNISQILTLDKDDLGDRIGKLSPLRVREVLTGIRLLIEPSDTEE